MGLVAFHLRILLGCLDCIGLEPEANLDYKLGFMVIRLAALVKQAPLVEHTLLEQHKHLLLGHLVEALAVGQGCTPVVDQFKLVKHQPMGLESLSCQDKH